MGVICSLINRMDVELEASVILRGSDDYSFIHVETYGYVVSYAPRLSPGDHHHYVWVRPGSEMEVRVPVAVHKQQGEVDVNIELSSQVS